MKFHICQIDTTVGDLDGNAKLILDIVFEEERSEYDIFVFPELTIIGYPPLDLLDNTAMIKEQYEVIEELKHKTKDTDALIIFGYAEINEGPGRNLFNSAMVIHKGETIFNYRKRLLPTYDVFDEARYFEPGKNPGVFFYHEKRLGIVICEDLWFNNKRYTINPAKDLFEKNVEIIFSLNSSPSTVGKLKEKLEMVKEISKRYGIPIIYVNQTGGNDDIVFDGNSFVTNKKGNLVEMCITHEEEITSVQEDSLNYHSVGIPHKGIEPSLPKSDAEFFFHQAVCGIKGYFRKCGFKKAVIGASGGIDSAVVTALASHALGGENVTCITMPTDYSSEGSYKDSQLLSENFNNNFIYFPIEDIFETYIKDYYGTMNTEKESKSGLMEENIQARIRGNILMAYSNKEGSLVLSTGNKSELSVGYCTIHGDMSGGLAPISDLYKMEVYAVAKFVNKYYGKEKIPQVIIDKEPSAELAPGQRDTDSLPSYPILDNILKYIIEGEVISQKVWEEDIEKVLQLVKRAEFKRRQAAMTIKMHAKAYGYGRRIPIAQSWKLSLHGWEGDVFC